ncbi:MAG: ABC transporter substrate-binding protein, partial [Acidimicrobiales bacterium]
PSDPGRGPTQEKSVVNTRTRYMVAVVVASALVAAACGDDDSSTPSGGVDEATDDAGAAPVAAGGEAAVSIGLQLEPATLDPTASPEGPIQTVELYNIIEPLVKIDSSGEIVPLLAESWEVSDDGLTYTFDLREGVTFHDGAELTAEDVVFSLDRARGDEIEHPFKAHLEPVASVTAIDDLTVEVALSEFSANFLFFLAQSAGMIFDESDADDLADAPVGTGPFAFREWVRGDHITVEANPDYWGDPPLLDEITYRYIEDPNALNNAMLAGDIQAIAGVSAPELLDVFAADPAFSVEVGTTNGEVTMALNNRDEALGDVRVRQALSYAVNRAEIVEGAYFGYGALTGTFAVPTDPYYVDLTDRYPYDPDRAQQLLAEAGFGDGLTLSMKLPPPSYARRSGEIIQSQLADVGVTLEIENVEWGVWLDDVFNVEGVDGGFDYDTSIVAHVEARDIIQYGNPDYYFGYDNPDVQDLLDRADAEPDDETRYELLGEVQTQITEDAASIWLFVLPQLSVTTAGVEGFVANATSQALDMSRVSYNP